MCFCVCACVCACIRVCTHMSVHVCTYVLHIQVQVLKYQTKSCRFVHPLFQENTPSNSHIKMKLYIAKLRTYCSLYLIMPKKQQKKTTNTHTKKALNFSLSAKSMPQQRSLGKGFSTWHPTTCRSKQNEFALGLFCTIPGTCSIQ